MKILFKTQFGSHLYGTNTPDSDTDYKAIYMSSLEDILLKRDRETIQANSKPNKAHGERNIAGDIDCEYIELRKFIKDAINGQTYALDMLFSTENLWEESSEIWIQILESRDMLLSRNVAPYIGYCRQQAGKYGLKGSRLGELTRVIDHLGIVDSKTTIKEAIEGLELTEFVQIYEANFKRPHGLAPLKEIFLDVLGKKFQLNRFVHEALFSLRKMKEKYGERAEQAMNNEGIDWKAVSHAFRCCYQLMDLAENHSITFPLKNAEYIKDIKTGKIPYAELGDKLYELMEEAKRSIENSDLPLEADKEFWDDFLIKTYL
jgi:hypothetical protein